MAIIQWISTLTSKIMRAWARRYRPERHYMRGPGPKTNKAKAYSPQSGGTDQAEV